MAASSLEASVLEICRQVGLEIVDEAILAPRAAKYAPAPKALDPAVRDLLEASYRDGLYSHQAQALQAVLSGDDVCLATSTASGKSDVFIAAAAHLLRQNGSVRVLALYPARALIQDQVDKWERLIERLKMKIGYIDGGVPVEQRAAILRESHVVLMTPDVAHAWLMSHLREREVARFMGALRLVVLDEAHVYDGVFGTNMAYFLRRFRAASAGHQLVCSTATLGRPADFVEQLTGKKPRTFGPEDDGSPSPPKTILLARGTTGKNFESLVNLICTLGRRDRGLFLAFGDSRRMVEQLVAAVHRPVEPADEGGGADGDQEHDLEADSGAEGHERLGALPAPRVLPYRAGYEAEDRKQIQLALSHRQLAGVVSTSALELGLDIGEIDLVVLLGLPPSVKAFWQRVGRAGRRNPGICLLIDDRGALMGTPDGLRKYLARELEPSWLYMENRYIQYANALCAAYELGEVGGGSVETSPFESLPTAFRRFLDNEINPTEVVPGDLYPLKQRAQAGPHREFPIRSGMEPDFDVKTPQGLRVGNLTFSQALREACPGAIYYYMARPYRVYRFDYRKGEISARREKHWITRPLAQTMVFPRFQGGVLRLYRSGVGFLAEAEMQVSERVLGFTERRGSAKPEEHRYGPNSPYHQREINRFFETTGVCWYFPDRCVTSESTAALVAEAFCIVFGVQDRDLGFGFFYSRQSPLGLDKCQGACVYDATNGSLRLTQRLAEHFEDVISCAIGIAQSNGCVDAESALRLLLGHIQQLAPSSVDDMAGPTTPVDRDWVVVIAPGETALYKSQDGPITVQVRGYRYTPQGLMYELTPPDPADQNSVWRVVASAVEPLHGETKMMQANLVTGETKPLA